VAFSHCTLPPIGIEIADGLKQKPEIPPQLEAEMMVTVAGLEAARPGVQTIRVARSVSAPLAAARRARTLRSTSARYV
jgi:hypothetical protein